MNTSVGFIERLADIDLINSLINSLFPCRIDQLNPRAVCVEFNWRLGSLDKLFCNGIGAKLTS